MIRGRGQELVGMLFVITIFFVGLALTEATKTAGTVTPLISLPPAVLAFPALLLAAHVALRLGAEQADRLILPLGAFLSTMGLLTLNSLNLSFADQLIWIELGLIGAVGTVLVLRNPERLSEFKYLSGALGVALLLAPIFFGTVRGGSKLWLVVGGYSFQPAEPAKILLAIFLAAYLAEKKEVLSAGGRAFLGTTWPRARHFGPLIVTWLLSLSILILERDLGSSLIFFSLFLTMLYVATGRVAFIAVGLALFGAGAALAYRLFSHVAARIDVWSAPLPDDISGSVYQVAQSLFALEAGGLSGAGLGNGVLGRAISMPAVHTDFIFSALAEETGLLGAAAILIVYLLIFARGIHAALGAGNDFLALLAVGLATVTIIQAVVIIGGVIKAIPLTGVTLPLVSYGGSSVVSSFLMLGLLLAISRRA